ncbi:MAG: tyrosine recombinase [Butyrivibrio sp.]|uniref:tyrosine recombinase n=1 Tax=Butyrivibrio sp. TaxID=28121 RepID=UPI0025E1D48E|nr:tyrosine recombinase [Butyrivibrio sp.]MCR5770985.1 tyrosine recombinase [Butyrivibrio sp.]
MEETIDEFISYLGNVREAKENSLQSYRRDLTRLMIAMRKENINSWSEVTEDQLSSYVSNMNEQLMADTTISRHISSIRSFWHFMVENGELDNDITDGLKAPHIEKTLPKILTEREIASLLEQPDLNTPKGKRDKAMLELLFATGIRVSEIASLKIDDIEFRLNCIDFKSFGQDRIVPFGHHARSAIMDYLKGGRLKLLGDTYDEGILFLSATGGKAMSRQGVWKMIKKYGKMAGIKSDITPFSIRHTFASHMIENGADIQVVQEMLGHIDIASTQKYADNKHNYIREIYQRTQPR